MRCRPFEVCSNESNESCSWQCRWDTWTNAGPLVVGPLGANCSEIWIKIHEIHEIQWKKMHLFKGVHYFVHVLWIDFVRHGPRWFQIKARWLSDGINFMFSFLELVYYEDTMTLLAKVNFRILNTHVINKNSFHWDTMMNTIWEKKNFQKLIQQFVILPNVICY